MSYEIISEVWKTFISSKKLNDLFLIDFLVAQKKLKKSEWNILLNLTNYSPFGVNIPSKFKYKCKYNL